MGIPGLLCTFAWVLVATGLLLAPMAFHEKLIAIGILSLVAGAFFALFEDY